MMETDVRQIAYAGSKMNGAVPRYDAAEYRHGSEIRRGILKFIFARNMLDVRQIRMCVVRRLRKIDPDPENRKVVEKFGHTRYAYAVGPNNATMSFLTVYQGHHCSVCL